MGLHGLTDAAATGVHNVKRYIYAMSRQVLRELCT